MREAPACRPVPPFAFMLRFPVFRYLGLAVVTCLGSARAEVVPAPLFRDHAVLQQGMPIPVWGTADDGEQVTVTLAGQRATTVARDGRWSVRLDPLPVGGPHTLTIAARNRLEFTDVLIGEVWVCSGQSNMERQLGLREWQPPITDWEAEAAAADYPLIRHFGVEQRTALDPQTDVGGEWLVCTPETVTRFSAVGYFFGQALHLARGTPIGLIHAAWGGTPAEAWTSTEGIAQLPEFNAIAARVEQVRRDPKRARAAYERELADWFRQNDRGSRANPPWTGAGLDSGTWPTMSLPTLWENAGLPGFDGVVWFRREIDLPADWTPREAELHLGAIDDLDTTWVNGHVVGGGRVWNEARVYRLARGLLRPGRNVIAVRVLDTGGGGGIWGQEALRLTWGEGEDQSLALAGAWRYQSTVAAREAPPTPFDPGVGPGVPTTLYNGMIAPLVPYAMRGVIWYQGEANAPQAELYQRLFPTMVADWRRAWGQGDFPFLYVQIAPFREMPPEIREAQRLSLDRIPNSAMAVTIDVGDAEDIHPANKRPVGERLALAARALAYGEDIPYSGPLYQALRVEGDRAILSFSHVGGGLVARGGELFGFRLAGADGMFHPARAKIVGDTVEVTAPEVAGPVAVRYGWANVAAGNLYNAAGLPASPFATDPVF